MKKKTWIVCILLSTAYFIAFCIFWQPHLLVIGNVFLAAAFIVNASKE